MHFSNAFVILLFIILTLLSFINTQESDKIFDEICSLEIYCSNCSFCQDYSKCNFSNVFCYKGGSDYNRDDVTQTALGIYYKKSLEIKNFCNSRTILVNSATKSFNIFESPSDEINNNKSNYNLIDAYHCDYYIDNKYYSGHDTDTARINLEIKKINEGIDKTDFNFEFFIIYHSNGKLSFDHFSDMEIRNKSFSKGLDKISKIEIMFDYFTINKTPEPINEYFVISFNTDNPSDKLRIIYLIVIILLCFFILIIIVLIIVYFLLKKKIEDEQERRIKEEEEKNKEKKRRVIEFIKNDLKSQLFSEKININDCDTCTICCDNFIIGQSQVSITPCLHVFHHDCISKWVKEKINNPCCPNCNYQFLEYINNPFDIKINEGNIKISRNIKNIQNDNNDNIKNNNEIKVDKIEETPPSEQLRINPRIGEEKKEKEKEKENSIHIHINEDGENDNNNK